MKHEIVTHETNQGNVIAKVHENPHIRLRQLAHQTSDSVSSVIWMLYVKKCHSFHLSVHQVLDGGDFENCLNFYQ